MSTELHCDTCGKRFWSSTYLKKGSHHHCPDCGAPLGAPDPEAAPDVSAAEAEHRPAERSVDDR